MRTTAAIILLGLGLGMVHGSAQTSERQLSSLYKRFRSGGGGKEDDGEGSAPIGAGCEGQLNANEEDDCKSCIPGTTPIDGDILNGCKECLGYIDDDGVCVDECPAVCLLGERQQKCKLTPLENLFDRFPNLPQFGPKFREALMEFREGLSKPDEEKSRRLDGLDGQEKEFHYDFEEDEEFDEVSCKIMETCTESDEECAQEKEIHFYTPVCISHPEKRYCNWPDAIVDFIGAGKEKCGHGVFCDKCQKCEHKLVTKTACEIPRPNVKANCDPRFGGDKNGEDGGKNSGGKGDDVEDAVDDLKDGVEDAVDNLKDGAEGAVDNLKDGGEGAVDETKSKTDK